MRCTKARRPLAAAPAAAILALACLLQAAAAPGRTPASPAAAPAATPGGFPAPDPAVWAPDVAEPGSVEAIRRFTTAPEFLPESVSYVPDSATVPSPTDVLGHLAGAEGELSSVAEVNGYFRRLADASDRVQVRTLGTSEEGREMLLVVVSDAENLARLDRIAEIGRLLGDPRATDRAAMRQLAAEGRAVYYLTGGLHSTETGPPEMLMELAYRLAVSERPEIRRIRREAVVAITPVVEVDGRDRVVEWFRRNLRGRDLTYDQVRDIGGPPYWGHYALHDNNRDGMQRALALTRAVGDAFYELRPQVLHDLHESLPLLYISTGHGPYSAAVDPVTINEWTQFAHHEAGALQAMGLPGVWVWAFWDGWWPGYLFSVANNHNSMGRFYETFGNFAPGTFERDLSDVKFVGEPVTAAEWYRPWPPEKKVTWSLRDNTNYMEAGILEALGYAALHREELLRDAWVKAERAWTKGRTEAPYAWVFPPEQSDPGRLAYLVNQLRDHRIEVHRLRDDVHLGDAEAGQDLAAGSYVVRMDQPYRNAALNFLSVQHFPPDEPNPPYDDVAWTWPLLYGVDGERIDDAAILEAPMDAVTEAVHAAGGVEGTGAVYLLADHGQNALLRARLLLGEAGVEAAEEPFSAGGADYPAGSWVVRGGRRAIAAAAEATGLRFVAAAAAPDVARHPVDLPRVGLLHTWESTQDAGWVRFTFDQEGMPYTLVSPDDLRHGGLASRFDVLIFPNTWGDFAAMVNGRDPAVGPLAYTRSAEYPSQGIPDASPDITGGMGLEGLAELRRFVAGGGVLVAIGNAGTLAVDGGLVRRVDRLPASTVRCPGSEVAARVRAPRHPVVYGVAERTSVFRGNGPLYEVARRDRDRVMLQFGDELPEEDDDTAAAPADPATPAPAARAGSADPARAAADTAADEKPRDLVLSGWVGKPDKLAGEPAILDVPSGRGRVLLYAFNPLHRYLNHSDFRLLYNVLLNWDDLP